MNRQWHPREARSRLVLLLFGGGWKGRVTFQCWIQDEDVCSWHYRFWKGSNAGQGYWPETLDAGQLSPESEEERWREEPRDPRHWGRGLRAFYTDGRGHVLKARLGRTLRPPQGPTPLGGASSDTRKSPGRRSPGRRRAGRGPAEACQGTRNSGLKGWPDVPVRSAERRGCGGGGGASSRLAPAAARGRGAGGQPQVTPPLGGPRWAPYPLWLEEGGARVGDTGSLVTAICGTWAQPLFQPLLRCGLAQVLGNGQGATPCRWLCTFPWAPTAEKNRTFLQTNPSTLFRGKHGRPLNVPRPAPVNVISAAWPRQKPCRSFGKTSGCRINPSLFWAPAGKPAECSWKKFWNRACFPKSRWLAGGSSRWTRKLIKTWWVFALWLKSVPAVFLQGEGIFCGMACGGPKRCSDFLIAQLVKNLPAMQEIPVQFLCWEDPLEKGKATHSSILAWRIPWTV